MHGPIMAVGNGVPALVCRWEEQTSEGLMWSDIGLGDRLFDLDVEAAGSPLSVRLAVSAGRRPQGGGRGAEVPAEERGHVGHGAEA